MERSPEECAGLGPPVEEVVRECTGVEGISPGEIEAGSALRC